MGTVTVEVEVPEDTLGFYGSHDALRSALWQNTVLDLVRRGEVTSRWGADALGMEWLDFIRLMGERGVPYFNYSQNEWEREVAAVAEMAAGARRAET